MQKIRALLRLILVLNRALLNGLDVILFDDKEIYDYTLSWMQPNPETETETFVERMNRKYKDLDDN